MDSQFLSLLSDLGKTLGPVGILIVLAAKWFYDARNDNGQAVQQKLDALLNAQQARASTNAAEHSEDIAERRAAAHESKEDLVKVFDILLARYDKLETSIFNLSHGVDELGRNVAEQTIVLREWRATELARRP